MHSTRGGIWKEIIKPRFSWFACICTVVSGEPAAEVNDVIGVAWSGSLRIPRAFIIN